MIPANLQAWLARVIPGLPEWRLVYRDPWTGTDGLTLGRTVYLRPQYEWRLAALDPAAIGLLCHELVHVEQFARAGWWWPVAYVLHRRAWEAAAQQRARELRAMWETERKTP